MSRVSILNYDEDYTCTRVATVTTTITKRSAGDFDNGRIKRARFQESTTKVIRNVAGQTEEITESSVSMENNFGDSCVTFGSSAELLAQSMKNAFNKMYQPNPLQICETDRFTDVTDLCASSAATANQPLSICDVIDLSDDPEEPKLDSPNDHKIDTEPPNVKPVALNRDPVVTQPSDPVGVNVLDKKYSCFLCQSVLSSKMDQANHLVSKKHQMFTNEMVQKGEICKASL